MSPKRPGGELATRPLHFFWLADCSGSMSVEGKIQALNNAVREALPQMRAVADENPNAQVLVRALKFSHGAEWHLPTPQDVLNFEWKDLAADPLPKGTANADIIFLLDTSGSMGDQIESVKKSCFDFADSIVEQGANVRMGLIGFDIGGHRERTERGYKVVNLSAYTIGIWTLSSPREFQRNVQSLTLGLFGGCGCYLANSDTVDIFPHVVKAFSGPKENHRILVIISDEMGDTSGLAKTVDYLKKASITTHVMGVPDPRGAHEQIARQTEGQFWDISATRGVHDFTCLLGNVAETIAKEVTKTMADGSVSQGTDMGAAMRLIAKEMQIPPMPERALPPVLVLISDGQPTDDFEAGLKELMAFPWAKKAVRIAIAMGGDADLKCLKKFIGHSELEPLKANNPEALVAFIKWASTAVLKAASSPASRTVGESGSIQNVALPRIPSMDASSGGGVGVW